ncbi:Long-chain-fatty-acid--CoA ligase [Planococcus halocryophilus Or1]|uniref:Long-chain fatty acid--CoA ligase n=1 Tax=Planococcus halocryophilus TaxID=1215089 RepID=A0A1C7DM48_9BACL|nr:fatty acid--CoA ligase family protein [Planococcus halocryophilus]ANU12497.1 long-chain fatty acid--CoA ligase [Planococcus halocryophilus]EMF48244.1 Long-chain-fatty-acid--CoA ligase [Planococcus halocryophilus Or1]
MSLMTRVHEIAKQNPTKAAYNFMGQDTSYKEFDQKVAFFAGALKELGVEKGDHVAFLLGNTPHFLISLYATMRLGATAVPINPIYTPDEIAYIVNDSDAKVVVALDMLLPLIEKAHAALPAVASYVICETDPAMPEKMAQLPEAVKSKIYSFTKLLTNSTVNSEFAEVEADDTAVILYTSGTTGKPKGAMLTHQNLYSNARDVGEYLQISETDRVVATLPVFHVFALTVVVNAPLLQGATIILVPRFNPKEVFEVIKANKATVFAGVPTMFNFMNQLPDVDPADFATVRLTVSGGSAMPVALLHSFEDKFNVRISEGYGLSEASPVTCFNPIDRERKAGSIGTSIINVENKVVNELGEEVAVNEVGELIVRGPNVMRGYYKMPEETASAIRDGWLYTGDLARVDEEGYFYIVDRKKDMIIVGGYNVYPREIEEVLFAHPAILEAAVVGLPDPDFGEEVNAYVVLKDPTVSIEDLKVYCAEHLAKYKVPRQFEVLQELPKNTTGKILRRSLKDQARQK